MEPSGSVPSARTAWTTGDGGMLPEGRRHARALGKKRVSDADLLRWVGICW